MVGKRVKRVIIEYVRPESTYEKGTHANINRNGRAVGIEYTTDARSPEEISGELVTVKASKLVVVSAGAFGSPSILERSGIGAPSVLEKHNIPILVDSPGVGENYQGRSRTLEPHLATDALCVTDHLGICPAFYAADETETMDDVWSDPKAIAGKWFVRLSDAKLCVERQHGPQRGVQNGRDMERGRLLTSSLLYVSATPGLLNILSTVELKPW